MDHQKQGDDFIVRPYIAGGMDLKRAHGKRDKIVYIYNSIDVNGLREWSW